MHFEKSLVLTHGAVMAMLQAGVAKAEGMGQPQCIVIVDASGVTLGQIRMTGAKYLSLKSAQTKARTAASIRAPSDAIPEAVGPTIAAATDNAVTRLGGGLPIFFDGVCVGGIGVGSGTADQDKDVAKAALAAIGAAVE
ncbi:heme-binding protein [Tateyamaria sp. ANG-S1]|uniref:GlcG/HbpS family heme-binding protein n=1 Tax=Tateyamaria sp. ANG-S1 TaxID=1577905 RepID=UPI00057C638F|nr:heme-binding protein [Tateyamaria sp. ANG-S1]KIC44954.1 glcg protein [Tateyamaria sp. ANG-S1]